MNQPSSSQHAVVKPLPPVEEETARYCWRIHDGNNWLAAAATGDINTLAGALRTISDVVLLAPGSEAVIKTVHFNPSQKRHLAQVIPFELEDELTEEPDDFHFALGQINGAQVEVAYIKQEWLAEHLKAMEATGIEVTRCLLEPLALPCTEHHWALQIDDEQITVRYGPQQGFCSHVNLAGLTLAALAKQQATAENLPQKLDIFVADDQDWQALLPNELKDIPASVHKNDGWQHIDPGHFNLGIDLRQGSFARRLPFLRWAREWRMVAAVAGIALAVFIGTNVAQIYSYNAKQAEVREQMIAVTREVIPQGNIADPERSLRARLRGNSAPTANGSAVAMLAKVGPLIAEAEKIILRTLNYDGVRDEMSITLQTDSYDTILKLRNQIQETGLFVQLGAVSEVGDGQQQARMTISRNNT